MGKNIDEKRPPGGYCVSAENLVINRSECTFKYCVFANETTHPEINNDSSNVWINEMNPKIN